MYHYYHVWSKICRVSVPLQAATHPPSPSATIHHTERHHSPPSIKTRQLFNFQRDCKRLDTFKSLEAQIFWKCFLRTWYRRRWQHSNNKGSWALVSLDAIKMYEGKWWLILMRKLLVFDPTFTTKQHWLPTFELWNGIGNLFLRAWEQSPLKK